MKSLRIADCRLRIGNGSRGDRSRRGFFSFNPQSAIRNRQCRGLTLVELLVTMGILVVLAFLMFWMVREVTRHWTTYERQRVIYEKGSVVLDRLAEDISLTQSGEPAGVTGVKNYFLGYYDNETGKSALRLTRSFEAGPERALINSDVESIAPPETEHAGGAPTQPPPAPATVGTFTGQRAAAYGPLGGIARVDYFVDNQTLFRSILAPAPALSAGDSTPPNKGGTPIAEDVLFFALDYWSQVSTSWEYMGARSSKRGSERVWDSSRGLTGGQIGKFILGRDQSLFDPSDDVFPQMVRVTLVVDAPMPRCVFNTLLDDINSGDGIIFVDSTQGFPGGGSELDSYILIDDEWIHYKKKNDDSFVCDSRGARGTHSKEHKAGSIVRTGHVFSRIISVPCFKEDPNIR